MVEEEKFLIEIHKDNHINYARRKVFKESNLIDRKSRRMQDNMIMGRKQLWL
jgi:hypothetical protein